MISLIFVNAPKNEFYGEILLNSIFKRTFLIDEIICVNTDKSTKEKYVENGIEIIKLGIAERICHNIHKQKFKGCEIAAGHQHAFGLQCGIEESKNDIIILSDSDVFIQT